MDTIDLWTISMILPILIILVGAIFRRHYPKTPNSAVGYRTWRSMQSQETWDYANRRFGQVVFPLGFAAAGVCALFNLCLPLGIGILILIDLISEAIFLIFPIFKVEAELKRWFDERGKPIEKEKTR